MSAEPKNLADLLKSNGYDPDGTNAISDAISTLPKSVKRRVQALKSLQVESINVEAEFYEAVHKLEAEFAPKFDLLNAKRKAIVTGEYEPTDEEASLPILHGLTEDELKKVEDASAPEPAGGTKGIEDFWLTLLKNADNIGDMIREYDEPILKHLCDITVNIGTNPNSFTLTFHFTPNEYFTQTELKKTYMLQLTPDKDDPFDYDGPMVIEAKGTDIDWKEGKNVTKSVITKKQKKPKEGLERFSSHTVQKDSFFNFFYPPTVRADDPDTQEYQDDLELLRADFEVGSIIRDQIVPRAVLFYTGEAAEDEDMFDEYEGDEEDSEDGDDSD